MENICPICSVKCTLSCSRCLKISYCGKDHQKSHWKVHKAQCFPAKISQDRERGRVLIASRDISQGEIILKEIPLCIGPSGKSKVGPICLECLRIVKSNYLCSNCQWPLCGPECQKGILHSTNECPIFSKNKITSKILTKNSEIQYEIYDNITTLRCLLLKSRNLEKWAKVLDLESHANIRDEKSKELFSNEENCKKGRDLLPAHFIRNVCKLKEFEEKEINFVAGTFRVNAFFSDDSPSSPFLFRSGTYLFYTASMTEHGCVPNAMWVISLNGQLSLRASIEIKASTPITQLYTEGTLSTFSRRNELKKHLFSCSCQRCSDPTEFKTYLSAAICQNCSKNPSKEKGILLPQKPLLDEDSLWICNLCSVELNYEKIAQILVQIKSEHDLIGKEDKIENVFKLEKILQKYMGNLLHPNNYLIHAIEQDIIQRISFLLASEKLQFSPNDVKTLARKLIELSRKGLKIADVIWPGLSRHRGRLVYFLQQGLLILLEIEVNQMENKTISKRQNKNQRNKFNTPNPIEKDLIKNYIDEIETLRDQGVKILSIEPEGRDEFYMFKNLSQNLQILQNAKKYISND